MTKKPRTPLGRVLDAFIDSGIAERIYYLKDRWQDEREHEDWKDYVEATRKAFAEHDQFKSVTRVTKHFTITVDVGQEKGHVELRCPANGRITAIRVQGTKNG